MDENIKNKYDEKLLNPVSGWVMLAVMLVLSAADLVFVIFGHSNNIAGMYIVGWLMMLPVIIMWGGFRILGPNEAIVNVLFGKYYGTVKKEGYHWINPFCNSFNPAVVRGAKKISLKAMTLNNDKQKVNDLDGNPIEIGVVVIWRIKDTAKAAFNVENYSEYVSIQSDAAIRNTARQFPYDVNDADGDEKSLRGSSQEIADMLCKELQKRVDIAGIEIVEARIAHLAYSQEIAAAMLQRQQAKAVVDARTTIVEGAVGMVELALEKLNENGIVELDEERKAQMVSNLMVVLCSNKDTQPIVNSGSLY